MYEVTDSKGNWLANAPLASRKDARDAVVAARKAFGGWSGATAYNRGQILYRVAEMLEGRRDQFVARGRRRRGPVEGEGRGAGGRGDRPLGLVRGLDRQDRPGRRRRQPGRGPVLQPLHPRADRRGRGPGPAGVVLPRPGLGDRPGDRHRQHGGRGGRARSRPLPALSLAEVLATSDLPGRRGQRPLRPHGGDRRARSPPTRTSTRSTWRAPDDGAGEGAGDRPRPTTSSGCSVRSLCDWTADPGTDRLLAFLETKTVWHPMGV